MTDTTKLYEMQKKVNETHRRLQAAMDGVWATAAYVAYDDTTTKADFVLADGEDA